MIRRPPSSKRTDTLMPCRTVFRSDGERPGFGRGGGGAERGAHPAPGDGHEDADAEDGGEDRDDARRRVRRARRLGAGGWHRRRVQGGRSEEQPSELQSLMRISYAVFCLKKNTINTHTKQQSM